MGAKETVKRNQSSMQVFKTLQLLLEDNYSMTELVQLLNANEDSKVFNSSVVSKYINTCRFCGFDIPKIHNKYFVANVPFGIELTASDLDLLDEFFETVSNTMSRKAEKTFVSFLKRLNKFSNKQIMRIEKDTKQQAAELFDKAIAEKRKVNLFFRAKTALECVPLKIIEKKGRRCFSVIHDGREKDISMDRIFGIEIMDRRFKSFDCDYTQDVVFKLKGELAMRYTLRENEEVITDFRPEHIVVSNKGEEKDALFSRLLRYDTCCEILQPLHYREEMKKLLDKMLSNYEA